MNLKTTPQNQGVVDGSIAVLARLEQMPVLLLVLNCELALHPSFDEYVNGDRFTQTATATDNTAYTTKLASTSNCIVTVLSWGYIITYMFGDSLIRNEIKERP